MSYNKFREQTLEKIGNDRKLPAEYDLKIIREYLGLNNKQMADAMGVHTQTWVKWERGENNITACPMRHIKTLIWLKSKKMLKGYFDKFC